MNILDNITKFANVTNNIGAMGIELVLQIVELDLCHQSS